MRLSPPRPRPFLVPPLRLLFVAGCVSDRNVSRETFVRISLPFLLCALARDFSSSAQESVTFDARKPCKGFSGCLFEAAQNHPQKATVLIGGLQNVRNCAKNRLCQGIKRRAFLCRNSLVPCIEPARTVPSVRPRRDEVQTAKQNRPAPSEAVLHDSPTRIQPQSHPHPPRISHPNCVLRRVCVGFIPCDSLYLNASRETLVLDSCLVRHARRTVLRFRRSGATSCGSRGGLALVQNSPVRVFVLLEGLLVHGALWERRALPILNGSRSLSEGRPSKSGSALGLSPRERRVHERTSGKVF